MHAIETKTIGKYRIEISHDEDSESPRDWSRFGRIIAWHRRYAITDADEVETAKNIMDYIDPDYDDLYPTIEEALKGEYDAAVVYPLYMYDHSHVGLSIGSFIGRAHHAEWDSGQVGYVYVTKKDILSEFGITEITDETLEEVQKIVESELRVYEDWMNGQVFVFAIYDETPCETCGSTHSIPVDSCGGFYGEEGYTEAMSEAEQSVAHLLKG